MFASSEVSHNFGWPFHMFGLYSTDDMLQTWKLIWGIQKNLIRQEPWQSFLYGFNLNVEMQTHTDRVF